jgi:hypothetical protein
MHDIHPNTADALPELLRQLKVAGFKVVHMVPKEQMTRCSNTERTYHPVFSQHRPRHRQMLRQHTTKEACTCTRQHRAAVRDRPALRSNLSTSARFSCAHAKASRVIPPSALGTASKRFPLVSIVAALHATANRAPTASGYWPDLGDFAEL